MPDIKSFGKRIKIVRNLRGMTQNELGFYLGYSNPEVRIAQYESGNRCPKSDALLRIAKILNVSPHALSPDADGSVTGFMENLFWLEEFSGEDAVYQCLQEWENMKAKKKAGEITAEEYTLWKLCWMPPVPVLNASEPQSEV